MPKQKITVEFTQKGAPQLTKSIHNLANAKNKLQNQTDIATKEARKYDRVQQRVTKNARNQGKVMAMLTTEVSVFRNKLLLGAFAYGLFLRPMVNISRAAITQAGIFESLETRLIALFGSVREGKDAFNEFNKIAATTPFAVQDIVNAGAQLQAFGADSRALLKDITNLAAFMGTNATEAANAFGRAFAGGAGAADILRERGILNLVKSFKGIDDISKLTLPEFRQALIDMIQDPTQGIAGATDRLATTFEGKYSNMRDAVDRLSASLGKSLIPTSQRWMNSIIRMSDYWGDFILALSETTLENALRKLKEMGLEADKLANLEMAVLKEDSLQILDDAHYELREILRTMGAFESRGMDYENPMTAIFDFSAMEHFGKEAKKGLSIVNKFLDDYETKFPLFTEIWRDMTGTTSDQLKEMKSEFDEFLTTEEGMKELESAIKSVEERISDLHDASDYGEEFDQLNKLYGFYNQIRVVVEQYGAAKKMVDEQLAGGKGNQEEVLIFLENESTMLKELNKMYEKSNHKRKETLGKYKELLVSRKADIIANDKEGLSLEKYNVVLKMVNDELDRLNEKKTKKTKGYVPLQLDDLKEDLITQNKELERMDELITILENTEGFESILDNLGIMSNKTKDANAEFETMKSRLEGLFSGTKEGREEAIRGNIAFIESIAGNKEVLDATGISADNLNTILTKLGKDLENLSDGLKLESWDEYNMKIKEQAAEFKNAENNLKILLKSYLLRDEIEQNYIKTQIFGLQTTDQVNDQIALATIRMENHNDMIKHVEGMYHGMNDIQKKVVISLGLLSDEFKAMNNIGVEETFGNIEQKLESLFQASTKGTVAGFMGDFSEYRKLRSELELQMEATDLTSDKKQELADRIKVLDAGYEILNKQYSDYVNNLHVGGRAQARLTKFMEKHNKISDTGLKAQRDELVAYKASINAIDDQAISTQALTDEKRNAERAILEFDAAQGDTDAAFKLYIMNTEDALAAEKLSKQFKEDLIRDYPVLAEFLGYTAQGYAYYVSQLQLANQKEEESLRNKMHLIRTDVDQARNLGLLGDTYEEFKTNLETQVATRDHLIAKTIKLRTEEGKLYDEMVKSGKIKSVEALTDEKRMANMTSLELLMDRIQKQRREETQTQNDLKELRQQEIDGYNTLYSQGVEMGIIKADVLEIDKNVLATQTELQAMIDEVTFTEMDRIRALQKLLSTSKDLNLTEEQKAIIYEKLNDRYFDIIESEQELIDSRQRLTDLDPMDALDVPDTSGFLAKHSGAFSSEINTLRDARKAFLEEATELEKPFDEIQDKLGKFDTAIEEFEIKDKALAIAGGLLDITEMFTDTLAMFVDAYQEKVEKAYQADLERLKLSERYTKANATDQKKMEEQIAKDHADERTKAFNYQKAISISEVAVSTGRAMMEAYATFWATGGQPWISLIAAFGAAQAGFIGAQQPPSYEYGGLVGGRRHSQGGTIIEAEQGEFVMSRQAVQAMGVENMKKINNLAMDIRDARTLFGLGSLGTKKAVEQGLLEGRYGSGGLVGMSRYGKGGLIQGMQNSEIPKSEPTNIVINFEGNILSDDFIIDEAIPKIREAIRRGDNILE